MADKALIEQLRNQIDSVQGKGKPVSAALKVGDEAMPKATRGRDPSSAEDAFAKIIALVNASDKSEIAIRNRLVRLDFSDEAIEEAVCRAKSYGFIDDMRYASVLIRSRLAQGWGAPGVSRELREQGIDILEVPGWPEEYGIDSESEVERALMFLERRPTRSKNVREGSYRKLIGKGYSSSVASSASRIWEGRQTSKDAAL